jgi:transposase
MPSPKTKRRRGRPTKYSPEIGERIVAALQIGAPVETAAAAAGITRETVRQWIKLGANMPSRKGALPTGQDGRPLLKTFGDFSSAVTRAFQSVEIKCLHAIMGAEDWRAKSWLLMNRHPDRYALPARRIVHTGGTTNTHVNLDGGVVDLKAMSDAELDQLDALTAKAIGRAAVPRPPPERLPDGSGDRDEDDE